MHRDVIPYLIFYLTYVYEYLIVHLLLLHKHIDLQIVNLVYSKITYLDVVVI